MALDVQHDYEEGDSEWYSIAFHMRESSIPTDAWTELLTFLVGVRAELSQDA